MEVVRIWLVQEAIGIWWFGRNPWTWLIASIPVRALFPAKKCMELSHRCAGQGVSVPCNIAEGQARNNSGEFRQFLGIARGSVAELETSILLCERLGYLDSAGSEKLLANCEEIQKLLTGLKNSLKPKEF